MPEKFELYAGAALLAVGVALVYGLKPEAIVGGGILFIGLIWWLKTR